MEIEETIVASSNAVFGSDANAIGSSSGMRVDNRDKCFCCSCGGSTNSKIIDLTTNKDEFTVERASLGRGCARGLWW
jgi:hypothetical protein